MLFLGLTAACIALASPHARSAEREFSLSIDEVAIQVAPDLSYQVFAFDGQVPGPLIHVKQGDDVVVHVTNNTTLSHTIHWHGQYQHDNWHMDGIPGVTQKAIDPGETFTYRFKAEKSGSTWYHCHVNVNEHVGLRGMWGPLIVDPVKPTEMEKKVTKDVIMMLSSWDSKYANQYGSGGGPLDVPNYFSINARSFPLTQPIHVKKGDVVRLRFFGAGGEIHSMHLHGHDMLVTHKDGLPLPAPYYADTILIGPGERYDAIVVADNPGIWMFHDHIDPHVTNNGKYAGGPMTVMAYDGLKPVMSDDAHGMMADDDPDFYYSESMKLPYGKHDDAHFRGAAQETTHRRHRGMTDEAHPD